MTRRRLAAPLLVLAGSVAPFVACGSVSSTTECSLDPQCAAPTSTQTSGDTGGGVDAPAVDSAACKPGDIKKVDCNTCTCDATGTFVCTRLACVDGGIDTGPLPSKCPDKAPKGGGEACIGATHCIYTDPCAFGCDCVDGHWKCVDCSG